MAEQTSCPCGSSKPLSECCQPRIDGERPAETAEALMRSRYTAYTLEAVDYVVATHDPDSADEVDKEAAATWAREADWLGLEIVDTVDGGPDDDTGVVEFVARFNADNSERIHHERSTFKRVDGRWYYKDGDMVKPKTVVRETPKVGRNEPCPCGSGKKFKKCCG